MTQFSLFGAAALEPSVDDLDGLLLAGAQWVRGAGGARLSVVVADRWRADALSAAFSELGLAGAATVVPAQTRWGVRTEFDAGLVERATPWIRGATVIVPVALDVGAGALRLWAIAAGRVDDAGYVLDTAPPTAGDVGGGPLHAAAGAQLSRLGVTAVALTHRGRPGWRVTSMRRLRRLVELLGPPPPGAGRDWPAEPGTGLGAPARGSGNSG